MEKFTHEVCEKIGYYVYRLVDPRNGQTFYVGKGKGNRVFAHTNYALKSIPMGEHLQDTDSDISLKVKIICDIHNAGFEVIHIIHRWGLETNTQALLIEAAVMDCYAGLSNIQGGYETDCSVVRVEQLQKRFSIKPFKEPHNIKYMIIKIKQSIIDERGSVYEAVRRAWKVSSKKINKYSYVLAVKKGIVEEVYCPTKWERNQERPDRYEFVGEIAPAEIQEIFKGKRIPDKYIQRGMSNPVLYSE